MRWRGATRPAGIVGVLGAIAAGAASNTGIAVAALGLLCGALQMLGRCCGVFRGPLVLTGLRAKALTGGSLLALQGTLGLALVGVVGVAVISLRAVAIVSESDGTPVGLDWCSNATVYVAVQHPCCALAAP